MYTVLRCCKPDPDAVADLFRILRHRIGAGPLSGSFYRGDLKKNTEFLCRGKQGPRISAFQLQKSNSPLYLTAYVHIDTIVS